MTRTRTRRASFYNGPAPAPVADLPTIPTSADELEDMLGNPEQMQAVFSNQSAFSEFIGNYARTVMDRDEGIAQQVRDETSRVLAEWLRENGADVDRLDLSPRNVNSMLQSGPQSAVYNPRAMGAAIDKEFGNAGEYFQFIWHNTHTDQAGQEKMRRMRNAFSGTVPSEGGFLVPESLRAELLRVSLETSIVRPRARTVPMDTLRVPFPCIDSTSNASSVYGGIVTYWTEEGGSLQASDATFGRVILEAKKLTAYCEVPNELISDSIISFDAFINQIFPEAMGWGEDLAFFSGSGAGEPLGFLNADATVVVTKEANQPNDTIVWENLVKMYSRMLPSSLGRAVWVCSIDTFPELATMALSVGTGGSAIWLNNGVQGPPASILGRPVIFTEKSPVLGDQGDVSFVDFGFYLIGDRQVMSAMSSPHFKFQNDLTAYRIIERVDGRPWLQSDITPANGGSDLSPFVQLGAR